MTVTSVRCKRKEKGSLKTNSAKIVMESLANIMGDMSDIIATPKYNHSMDNNTCGEQLSHQDWDEVGQYR